ncbi:hypothetical protein OGATHE_005712 [Ogataea polymorpha]|uniref:Uncharacterized protein n=1 Tax=Ogataea polymorpha TaxID=460523 RepID=A0A9P8NUY4_9ASCO|nr:hypothetical protein OGATHE_005712 [Ogataea polymorpha]
MWAKVSFPLPVLARFLDRCITSRAFVRSPMVSMSSVLMLLKSSEFGDVDLSRSNWTIPSFLTESAWRRHNHGLGSSQSLDLGLGSTLAARDQSTGVAHSSSWRSSNTGNEGDNGLWNVSGEVVLFEVLGSLFLGLSADFTDQNDTFCFWVVQEQCQGIYEVGTWTWVTSHSDDQRLAQTDLGGLVDGLVREGSRSRNNADSALFVDVLGHDSDLALLWSNDSRTVRSDQSGLGLGSEHLRNKDTAGGSSCLLDGIRNTGKHGLAQVGLAGLLWVGSTNNLGTICQGLFSMEGGLFSRETLVDHLGVLVDLEVLDRVRVVSGCSGG